MRTMLRVTDTYPSVPFGSSPPSASLFRRYTQMSTRIFALVVGIDYYKSGKIWNLHSCVDDAKKIKRWLMDDLQVPADHISTLLDRQATKQNIEDQFSQHLVNNRRIERGDAILFYFAGHGSRLSAPDPWYPPGSECQTVDVLCAFDHDTSTEQGRQSGISDRSFHAMMGDLCSSKGNNITVVLDCCFAPTQNRSNIRDRSITRWTRTFKASPDDLYRGLWPTARIAPSAATSGFYTPQESHIALGACSSGGKALEDKNGGRFTTSLLRAASTLHLHRTSYVQWVECASQNGGETFVCIGKPKDEMIFNEVPFPTDNTFVSASFDPKTLTLRISMGAIHGLTEGSQLSLHLHNRRRSLNPPIANAVVSDVHGTWCYAQPTKPLLDPPTSCWAKVTKWCTRRPFYVRIRRLSWMPRNGIALLRSSLSFGAKEKADKNVFVVQKVNERDSPDVTLTLESKGITTSLESLPVPGGLNPSIVKLNNNDPSAIIDQATRFNLHLHTGNTTGPLRDQVDMELYRIDPFLWSKAGDNLLSSTAEPIPYEEGALYQIILHNRSHTDLWPYLAYFDTSRLSITLIWGDASHVSEPPLPSQRSLQIGSGVPGSEAFVFTLPEGAISDVSYLKLFYSSTPTSMKVIEQDLDSGFSRDLAFCADLPNDAYIETAWGSLTRTLCFVRH